MSYIHLQRLQHAQINALAMVDAVNLINVCASEARAPPTHTDSPTLALIAPNVGY